MAKTFVGKGENPCSDTLKPKNDKLITPQTHLSRLITKRNHAVG